VNESTSGRSVSRRSVSGRSTRSVDGDRGSVTAFAIVMSVALVLCAGLVFDGGRMVMARHDTADLAENAARFGAQEITSSGGGRRLDTTRALAAAQRYLRSRGAVGSVSVSGQNVVVSVTGTVNTTMLKMVGIGSRSVTVRRSAAPADS
jgi:Flp pilus assembly protein TadG